MNKTTSKILFILLTALLFIFIGLYLRTKFKNHQPSTTNYQLSISPTPTPLTIREKAHVNYVFDGDTIEIAPKITLRLLGIDAPETANKYTLFKAECFASESAKIAKTLMMNQDIEMEKDVEDKDKYGRLLRYVFLDDVFINEFLVRNGYAKIEPKTVNVKYKDTLIAAEIEAKREKRGLWGKCPK